MLLKNLTASLVSASIVISGSAGAAIVLNNTTNPTGQIHHLLAAGQVHSLEHGNVVTLASHERMVTLVHLRMRTVGPGWAGFNLHVRLYKPDAETGGPDPVGLLWYSGPLPRIIDSGFDNPYQVAVPTPGVRVPQDGQLIWTVQATDRWGNNMSAMGPTLYSPPTVGEAQTGYWSTVYGMDDEWEFLSRNQTPFSVRIEAQAIPGDLTLNGGVDVDDLLLLLAAWGACPLQPAACPGDIAPAPNGDGGVNIDDLLALLANWG